MKKIILILFFGILAFTSFSQKNKHYTSYIGVSVQPSHYWLYNKDEFNAPDTIFGVKNDSVIVNGLSYGLSYGHFFKKSFGINVQLLYSTQTQYYEFDYSPWSAFGNWYCRTNLKYIKMPLSFTSRKEISNNKFIYLSYGIQTSFLTYYIDDAKMTASHSADGYYYYTEEEKNTFSKGVERMTDTAFYYYELKYKRFVFGANLSLGYEQYINNKMSFTVGIKADYDITNVDNTHAVWYHYKLDKNGNINRFYPDDGIYWPMYRHGYHAVQYDRKASHNIHLGIEFGFKYWFSEKTMVFNRKIPREW